MKIAILSEGSRATPASRIRVYELFDRLAAAGAVRARIFTYTSDAYCRRVMRGEKIGLLRDIAEKVFHIIAVFRFLCTAPFSDIVWIQRLLLPVVLQRLIRRLCSRVVYDFDDAVYLYGPRHAGRFACQMALASEVIAVSRLSGKLAEEKGAGRDRVSVVYTPVDCARFEVRGQRDTAHFTVGWIGSLSTSPYLEEIWPELEKFAAGNERVRFVFIGCRQFDTGIATGAVRFVPWSAQAEVEELPRLDVGLMPLADTEWERGKGGYKLIQYMAAGVATVASPVGANLEIVVEGHTGLFARESGDWAGKLEELLSDRERCLSLGLAGRRRAEELFDYDVAAAGYRNILQRLFPAG